MTEAATQGPIPGRAGPDFGLNAGERRTLYALVAGHLLFVAALFTVAEWLGDYGLYIVTILYGLPLLLVGPRDRIAVRALVLLAGFPALHWAAASLARQAYSVPFTGQGFTDSMALCGAIGGAIGAAGSFALCALCGLLRPDARAMAIAGTLVLTILGALGLSAMFSLMPKESVTPMLLLYTPWQLAFAYFLAKTVAPAD